jgi:hypothetical protein
VTIAANEDTLFNLFNERVFSIISSKIVQRFLVGPFFYVVKIKTARLTFATIRTTSILLVFLEKINTFFPFPLITVEIFSFVILVVFLCVLPLALFANTVVTICFSFVERETVDVFVFFAGRASLHALM